MSGDMEKWDGLAKVLGLQPGESLMDATQRVLAQLGHALAKSSGRVNEQRARAEKAEKVRDEAIDKAIDYMAACTRAEAERDAGLLRANELAPRVAVAEAERDAATGALAAAQAALKRWRDEYEHAEDCEWMEHIDAEEDKDCTCYKRVAAEFLSSPAADLAARHDAEVTRRALEKVLALPSYGPDGFPTKGHLRTFISIADIQALAAPSLEKPR